MRFSRRRFIQTTSLAGLSLAAAPSVAFGKRTGSINRRALVQRHNPRITAFDPFSALSVGNGEFAFTADITGLQTFSAQCEKTFPLCTMSHWGWHSEPAPDGLTRADLRLKEFDTNGRKVGYATDKTGQEPLFNWLRQNPHGLHLGRLAFQFQKSDGSTATPADLQNPSQTLDLWTGLLDSRFIFEGQPVNVQTCAHPVLDAIAVRIESPLLTSAKLHVLLAFPYGSPEMSTADWLNPDRHTTTAQNEGPRRAAFSRKLDNDSYGVALDWTHGGSLTQKAAHEFLLSSTTGGLEFVCAFAPQIPGDALPTFSACVDASAGSWNHYWLNGGVIDLSDSTDSRAQELERRIVLSLYNSTIHSAGSLPPAETGLLCNTWAGKFHLEMHWWHGVHFTAWNRFPHFERSLGFYHRILPVARDIAKSQGYRGARWPKMTDPSGYDSPSSVGPLIIWQQPHPIYYAELCYRRSPRKSTLQHWQEIVFESAEFMADFVTLDAARDRFMLESPLKTVSENNDTNHTLNPSFELTYWRFGLSTALAWCDRLGRPRPARWLGVLQKLSPPPVADGCYLMEETMPDTYTQWNWEHPAMLGILGVQPGQGVDAKIMRRTARRVFDTWRWDRCWGWDFPMAAMAAARSGDPGLALDFLMYDTPKNHYLPNGHNRQRDNLPAYLPGNGGLLAAAAMMAGGWSNGPHTDTPGFPKNGKWNIRHENLNVWM